ncbi:MAG: BlaI/MecI/CopY family transcriptional regulator [Planctomycetota bacterium]|nr:BlaI/MecI/CopY family transcriptional regulator [Planctomycetota bacterium]
MDEQIKLSRRERQIMDIVYGLNQATATDVLMAIPDQVSRATVRTLLRILEEKGHLKHHKEGREFVYKPVRPRHRAGQSALRRILSIFFDGSLEKALAYHLADPATSLEPEERDRLIELIRKSSGKGD